MASLKSPPKLKLSQLRDIGWSLWDPIGLFGPGKRWDENETQSFADEYDAYLMEAAARLRRGATDEEVTRYLVGIEADHMGFGHGADIWRRASMLVDAMRNDEQLWIK